MTRNVMLLAAAVILSGLGSARAEPDVIPTGATVMTAPDCTNCGDCGDCSGEQSRGLIIRIQKKAAARNADKCVEPCCPATSCDDCCPATSCEPCDAKKRESKVRKFCEWLCYKPGHRCGLGCECKQRTPCCNPPLWSFFPCEGCGRPSIVGALNTCCDSHQSANPCKTATKWEVGPCCTTSEPCLAGGCCRK